MNYCKSSQSVDLLDNLYHREKNAYKLDKQTIESLDDNVILELRQLDNNLDELFLLSNDEFNNHHAIHKYRLRLSRRISSYTSILKSLLRQCEYTTYPQHRVKLYTLHQFYTDRLMKDLEGLEYEESADNDNVITRKLRDTRNMMISQLNQMHAAESSLLKSSNYISQQEDILKGKSTYSESAHRKIILANIDETKRLYPVDIPCFSLFIFPFISLALKERFSTATVLFSVVRRETIRRYGIVRCCYFFFLFVCIFITLRRFRVFRLVYLIVRLILYPFALRKKPIAAAEIADTAIKEEF